MNVEDIFTIITNHTKEVLPDLESHSFQFTDSLKALGANSIDRSEIVMMSLESLDLSIPLLETVGAENIGELAQVLHAKL